MVEQEARKSKVSRGEEEWNLKARPLFSSQLSFVFIPSHRDLRVRTRMEYHKKGGFSLPRKGIEAACRSLLIVSACTDIRDPISMQAASTHVIYSLYDKKEVYYSRKC